MSAAGERKEGRKATVEIQRRPGRQGTMTGGAGRGAGAGPGASIGMGSAAGGRPGGPGVMTSGPGAGVSPGLSTAAGVEGVATGLVVSSAKDLPGLLKNVYAPPLFDYSSGIFACNFPAATSSLRCRNFFSWIAPVVRVDRLPSLASFRIASAPPNCACFLVVFANPLHAQRLLDLYDVADKQVARAGANHLLKYIITVEEEIAEGGARDIYIKPCDREITWKTKISDFFTGGPSTDEATARAAEAQLKGPVASQQGGMSAYIPTTAAVASAGGAASQWVASAGNATGEAFYRAGNTISDGWHNLHASEHLTSAGTAISDTWNRTSASVRGYF